VVKIMIVFIYLKLKERAVLFGIDFASLITETGISCNKTCAIAFLRCTISEKMS